MYKGHLEIKKKKKNGGKLLSFQKYSKTQW